MFSGEKRVGGGGLYTDGDGGFPVKKMAPFAKSDNDNFVF